ncbi:MAG: dTDP-4-dehydrorhamnose reductase [Phycisphaerae bacterium]
MSPADWASGSLLVLGAKGMLGHELVDRFRQRLGGGAHERLAAWGTAELDIRDRDAVFQVVTGLKPSVVVNAAAYTDVNGCETNVELAMAVNGQGPGNVAQACAEIGSILVHFGTDFIFDGRSDRPYRPDDAPNPLSVYGRSKWEGEQAVRATECDHLIIRTSWLFGPHGRNFVEAILSRVRSGESPSVVTDQVGRPTLASDLAEAVVRLLDAGARGTVHFANLGQCSWFGFAQEIVKQMGGDVPVQPIRSDQLGAPAKRPAYSVMDLARYVELTDHTPAPWQDALSRYPRCKEEPQRE